MPLTPADIRNKTFNTTRLRPGYEEDEVDAFLDEVEAELDRLVQENEELRAKLAETLRGKPPTMASPIVEPRPDLAPEPSDPLNEQPGAFFADHEPTRAEQRARHSFDEPPTPRPVPPDRPAPLPSPLDPSRPPPKLDRPEEFLRPRSDPAEAVRSAIPPSPAARSQRQSPDESIEVHEEGQVRVISFGETERLLLDHGSSGQILNWTTALSPSVAGVLALELADTEHVRDASICISGETGDISPRLIASLIHSHPPAFDSSCEFFRIDFDDKSIAYQTFRQETGPPIRFLGIAAERLSLPLVAALIVQSATRHVVDATLSLGEYRLLDQLDRLLAEELPSGRTANGQP